MAGSSFSQVFPAFPPRFNPRKYGVWLEDQIPLRLVLRAGLVSILVNMEYGWKKLFRFLPLSNKSFNPRKYGVWLEDDGCHLSGTRHRVSILVNLENGWKLSFFWQWGADKKFQSS